MRDLLSWNLALGRWAGVQVRLHVFFVLFAVFALHFSFKADLFAYGCAALVILLASALAHEFGHCLAARKLGGKADQVLIWPFGGLAHVNVSQDPHSELVTSLAGPMVNLVVAVGCALALLALGEFSKELLNPLQPPHSADSVAELLELAFWLNWLMALVNLLPAFPLDGGRALRAWMWQRHGYRMSVLIVVRTAKFSAVALWLAAWLVRDANTLVGVSPSLPLALLGIFLFFSAKQEGDRLHESDSSEPSFGYDFSQGYTSLEKYYQQPQRTPEPGPVKRWLEARRQARLQRKQEIEEEEERRVDEVLARLHESGRDGLTAEDRALLDRVSARYRNRQRG
jgi:Zn-dependent protease